MFLERLWCLDETGKNTRGAVCDSDAKLFQSFIGKGFITLEGEVFKFTEKGYPYAQGVVRRRRLTEVLLHNVLELSLNVAETSACKIEHIINEEVTDSICTFLGHPVQCPHGKPIPRGGCCKERKDHLKPLIEPLKNLSVDIKEEAMVIADAPMTMSPDDVVNWGDTDSQRQRGTNVAYYYPHSLMSNIDGKTVFGSASGTAIRTITFSDSISEIWFAPAGTRRGLVSGVTQVGYITGTLGTPTTFVEATLSEGQRDNLYKYFTNINPIPFLPGRGILVFGQKTSSPDASARDRINVERMLMYIKRQLRKNALAFVFEPNDSVTRANLKAMVDGFLNDILVKRGLYDFASLCDESNNTPDRIDRNEMYIDILLKPTKAAEFISIPIRVVATDAEI